MSTKTDGLKKYEAMFIFSPELVEKKREEAIKHAKSVIEEGNGKVESELDMGMRDTAYPIKKHNRGYYTVWHFWQDPQKLAEIDRTLSLEAAVLRHLFVAVDEDATIVEYPEELVKTEEKEEKPAKAAPKKVTKAAAPKKKESKELGDDVEKKLSQIIDSDITL